MSAFFTALVPAPQASELPSMFPSPLDELEPHPLARRSAEMVQAALRADPELLGAEGKMVGVLVVRAPTGEVGFLRGFSGTIAGSWIRPGFVPPVFDAAERERIERPGEERIRERSSEIEAVSKELAKLTSEREREEAAWVAADRAMVELHRSRKQARARLRAELGEAPGHPERVVPSDSLKRRLHALDQESRGDKAERRRLDAAHAELRAAWDLREAPLRRRLRALERLRRWLSRRLMREIFDCYRLPLPVGGGRALRSLFGAEEPPSGAADCAAPKLLAFAHRHGLAPLALAEFWWGPPPPTGGRREGAYYPACARKCAPLLPTLLEGIPTAPPRRFALSPATPALEVLFEDDDLVAIDKPCDLLSIPGKGPTRQDSVLTRLRARYPTAQGPLLVHRLDQETSGVLLAALHPKAHAALQRQFLSRTVHKRYVALLDGEVPRAEGRIRLALRVDVDDRPRQIHDPLHGRDAVTDFQVLAREGGRTRVALFPRTGRTHQLRAHAAHPLGLNAPIHGDRLYGHPDSRLFLHAEELTLLHPRTGTPLELRSPAPF